MGRSARRTTTKVPGPRAVAEPADELGNRGANELEPAGRVVEHAGIQRNARGTRTRDPGIMSAVDSPEDAGTEPEAEA